MRSFFPPHVLVNIGLIIYLYMMRYANASPHLSTEMEAGSIQVDPAAAGKNPSSQPPVAHQPYCRYQSYKTPVISLPCWGQFKSVSKDPQPSGKVVCHEFPKSESEFKNFTELIPTLYFLFDTKTDLMNELLEPVLYQVTKKDLCDFDFGKDCPEEAQYFARLVHYEQPKRQFPVAQTPRRLLKCPKKAVPQPKNHWA